MGLERKRGKANAEYAEEAQRRNQEHRQECLCHNSGKKPKKAA